eukprot:1622269-Amphidinium_carterae.1
MVGALEECSPRRVVSNCKGVVKTFQALQKGYRQPKGRHRDLEGRVSMEDFQDNQEAVVVANLGAAEQVPHKLSADWLHWEQVAKAVRHFWLLVGPKLRERLEAWPRVWLPTLEVEPDIPLELLVDMLPQAPHEVGPHTKVVEYD